MATKGLASSEFFILFLSSLLALNFLFLPHFEWLEEWEDTLHWPLYLSNIDWEELAILKYH